MDYSKKVMDLVENPKNVGTFDEDDPTIGTAMIGSPACGDVMKLQIKVENDVIVDTRFKTFGCGAAVASSSMATEWLKGKTITEALEISNAHIAETLELPAVKVHCSVLAEDAVKGAIEDWKSKNS